MILKCYKPRRCISTDQPDDGGRVCGTVVFLWEIHISQGVGQVYFDPDQSVV